MSKGVIIYGMHRSGTSLVANWFVRSGFSLGSGDLMAAADDNPMGFYEREDVVALNDEILANHQLRWSDVRVSLPQFSLNKAIELKLEQIALDLHRNDLWLIKDPRINLVSSIWESTLKNAVRVVVMRNPVSVAQSLNARNKFPLNYGLKLWATYNNAISDLYDDSNTFLIFYENILSNPDVEFDRLAKFLFSRGFTRKFVKGSGVVNPELNHSVISEALEDDFIRKYSENYERLKDSRQFQTFSFTAETQEVLNLVRASIEGQHFQRLAQFYMTDLEHERSNNKYLLQELEDTLQELEDTNQIKQYYYQVRDLILKISDNPASSSSEWQADYILDQINRYDDIARSAALFLQSRIGKVAKALNSSLIFVKRGNKGDSAISLIESHLKDMQLLPFGSVVTSRWSLIKPYLKQAVANPRFLVEKVNLRNFKRLCQILVRGDERRLQSGNLVYDANSLVVTGLNDHDVNQIVFEEVANPMISIVIPVFNHFDDTIRCLAAIQRTAGKYCFEVIVSDDRSVDDSFVKLKKIEGIKAVQVEANGGFVSNCNFGASYARGEFIVFLNNDTEVQDNWLDSLINTIGSASNIGVVGSKLVYPNGTLQEAGGIIFSDASGWNYGRNDLPFRPEYSFRRYVDYVSGAVLLTRKKLWDEIGGFDTLFAPAYYEDTDYCFAVREKGYRICFEPKSVVVHYEGVSNGTDEQGEGLKQFQKINKEKFKEKWNSTLLERHYGGSAQLKNARLNGYISSILIFDHYVPMHDKDAGSRSTRKYVESFVRLGYHVTFIGENLRGQQPYTKELQEMGVEVIYGNIHRNGLRGWFEQNLRYFDILYTHRPHITHKFLSLFIAQKKQYRYKWIYFGHDLHYLRAQRDFKAGLIKVDDSELWKEKEFDIINSCDLSFFPSEVECEMIRKQLPDVEVKTLPLMSYDTEISRDENAATSKRLIFVGGFGHPPNLAGLEWFLDTCWSQVNSIVPEASLNVIGSNMPESLFGRNDDNVNFLGSVSDEELITRYKSSACAIVPLLSGAGIKGKVLEAMSLGVPVWSTSIGAEGINFDNEQWVCVADEPKRIISKIVELLLDEPINRQVGLEGKRYIEKFYSQNSIDNLIRTNFLNK